MEEEGGVGRRKWRLWRVVRGISDGTEGSEMKQTAAEFRYQGSEQAPRFQSSSFCSEANCDAATQTGL